MRTMVVISMLCLLFCLAGCFESNTASVYGNPESDGVIGVRLGTDVAENLEVGALTYLNPYDSGDYAYGAYSLLKLPIGPITPYIGAEARIGQGTWDIDDTIQPVAGVTLWDFLFAEYQHEAIDGENDKIMFGTKLKF